MKHLYFKAILLCFCLLASINAFAYDAEIDGIYYNFPTDSTAEVTFQSSQGWPDYTYISDYSGDVVIPEVVSYNGNTYSITTIGTYAFSRSSALISVSIPESVTNICEYAFSYCNALTSVTIPESVTNIDRNAFSDCM